MKSPRIAALANPRPISSRKSEATCSRRLLFAVWVAVRGGPTLNAEIEAVAEDYAKEAERPARECFGKRDCPCKLNSRCLSQDVALSIRRNCLTYY
jgi:hypothetical protein